jgi:proliferating cell nuclear antigen PCNA
LETVQTSTFKSLIISLKEILVETKFNFTKKYVTIIDTDNKENIFVYTILKASEFEHYYCEKTNLRICINLGTLLKTIKTLNNNCTLTLSIEKDSPNLLNVKISNTIDSTSSLSKIQLLDFEVKENNTQLEKLVYDHVIGISQQLLKRICSDMSDIGNEISITATNIDGKRRVKFGCNGELHNGSISKEEVINESDDKMSFLRSCDVITKGVYNVNHLSSLVSKCLNISSTGIIKMYLMNNSSLVIGYDINKLGSIMFFLKQISQKK